MKGIILLANHFEDTEALVTIDLLRRAGITVDMVSIEKSVDLVTQYNLKIKQSKKNQNVFVKEQNNVRFRKNVSC